jgi:hypothetical protein
MVKARGESVERLNDRHEQVAAAREKLPLERIRLDQVRELTGRFGLTRPEHLARVLRISDEEATNILVIIGFNLKKGSADD